MPGLPLLPRAAVRATLVSFARRFRREILDADAAVGDGGLSAAADLLLARYSGPVDLIDVERVPATGPLLVVANHPGTVDTPALWRLLSMRRDLRIIALDRPFLRAVPNIAGHLLYVPEDGHQRTRLVHEALEHLRPGGALLSFPAGETEPDPAIRRDAAVASLAGWSRSPELFARLVPELTVLPVAVSGVLAAGRLRHPLVRVHRTERGKDLAAATMQIIAADRSITPRVRVGLPVEGPRDQLTERVLAAMTRMLAA